VKERLQSSSRLLKKLQTVALSGVEACKLAQNRVRLRHPDDESQPASADADASKVESALHDRCRGCYAEDDCRFVYLLPGVLAYSRSAKTKLSPHASIDEHPQAVEDRVSILLQTHLRSMNQLLPLRRNDPRFHQATFCAQCTSSMQHELLLPRCYVCGEGRHAASSVVTPRSEPFRFGPCHVFRSYASSIIWTSKVNSFSP